MQLVKEELSQKRGKGINVRQEEGLNLDMLFTEKIELKGLSQN